MSGIVDWCHVRLSGALLEHNRGRWAWVRKASVVLDPKGLWERADVVSGTGPI